MVGSFVERFNYGQGGKTLSADGKCRLAFPLPYGYRQEKNRHESMITEQEFDRVQIFLGRKGKPRPKTHTFPFTGLIRCKE